MTGYLVSSNSPLVSVIIPAYNAEAFIERTLESVLAQTYTNFEVIVVDDGSTDGTVNLVKGYAQSDARITLLQQANAGVAAARNLAIAHSSGELIAPIDADDTWYPQNLEKQVHCMLTAGTSVGVVYSWSIDIDEADTATGEFHAATIEGNVYTTLVCHNFLGNASCTLIHRRALEKAGLYNCELKKLGAQGCEDWDLYLRLAEHCEFRVVSEFLVGYRKVISSMSRNYDAMAKSHYWMLQFAKERRPATPNAICRLSSSSFYLYLARQSRQYRCYRGTLFWLQQAIQSDFVTPIFRLGFYWLLVESYLKLAVKEVSAWVGSDNYYWVQLKQWVKGLSKSHKEPEKRPMLNLQMKLLVGNFLHSSIPLLFNVSRSQRRYSMSR